MAPFLKFKTVPFCKDTAVNCLEASLMAMKQVKYNVLTGTLTPKKIINAEPSTLEHMARAALAKEMEAVAENLRAIKRMKKSDSKLPEIFKNWKSIKKQRNHLVHRYGHGHSNKSIVWEDVVAVLNDYPRLESAVLMAIKNLKSTKNSENKNSENKNSENKKGTKNKVGSRR